MGQNLLLQLAAERGRHVRSHMLLEHPAKLFFDLREYSPRL